MEDFATKGVYVENIEVSPSQILTENEIRNIIDDYTQTNLSFANLHVVDCAISGFDRNVMLFDFGKGCSDWNDLVIVEVCKGGGYSLVTNDGDFKDVTGVTILTHNPKLFAR